MCVVEIAYTVFWVSSFGGFIGLGACLSSVTWLPGWVTWTIASIGGAAFGGLVTHLFARLPGVIERYQSAPVNGATGQRVGCAEVLVPYTMVVGLCLLLVPGFSSARSKRSLPPLRLPPELVA